ncbi:amidohydrolase family protein [Deminuibacter soli]|uniref:Amidohydrolase n=1 Tax=Deminuibacter soli TaxID=2291815 RepID=A0A3E1NP08_9BACT|nr:amidohydrolase family protein [Deminuibacter soli]RFM29662.1 amidohydrolase [Deminuibacter soli]
MKPTRRYALTVFLLLYVLLVHAQKDTAHYHGKIIDMHVHIAVMPGEENTMSGERNHTLANIRTYMAAANVEKAAIITIAQKGNMADTRQRNDSIIALSKKYPSLIPVCSVHPMDGADAFAEMERVHKQGVSIIKLHPNSQGFDVGAPEVASLAKKAGELHLVLLFDSYSPVDNNEIGKLIMLAAMNQDTRFIFAHMGLVNFPQLLTIEALKKYPWYKNNIWCDISAIAPVLGHSPFHDQLVWTIRTIGVDQFLFGSDYPVFNPADAIKSVHGMGFTRAEEQLLFYGNASRLLQQ